MRLKTTRKTVKKSNSTGTEKQTRKKNSKEPKIVKNFNSKDKFRAIKADIDLTRLTYGVIEGHKLEYVNTPDGVIYLNDSWIEFILLMLYNVIINNPSNFQMLLAENNVASQTLFVDKVYGKYTFEASRQYKVYEIYNTGYYLESLFESSDIFSAVIGLCKICGFALDEVKLSIEDKEYIEKKLNFDLLEDGEIVAKISDVASMQKQGMRMVEFSFMGVNASVHDIMLVAYMFAKWTFDTYGDEGLLKLPKYKSTGISKSMTREDVNYMQVKGSELFIYTDGNDSGIIKFIQDGLNKLLISEDLMKFKFKALKK